MKHKVNKLIVLGIIVTFLSMCVLHKLLLEEKDLDITPQYHPFFHRSHRMMWTWILIYIGFFVYALFLIYDIPTPYTIVLIYAGVLWGIVAYNHNMVHAVGCITYESGDEMIFIYLSTITFNMAFCIDVNVFFKTLPQVLMLGVVVEVAAGVLFGLIAVLSVESTFDIRHGLLLGLATISLSPQIVTSMLRQETMQTRQVSVLIDGDALITLLLGDIIYKTVVGYEHGFLVYWYQFVLVLLRMVVCSLLVGLLMSYIGRFLLRKICIKPLHTLLVCFAVPLFTYSFAEIYASGCGAIAMLTVGIILGLERTYLPKNMNRLVTNFWDMVGFIVNSIITVNCLILCTTHIVPRIPWGKFTAVVIIFFICYTVRLFCFLIFLPILQRLGPGMSLKEMVICVCGGIKGPISLLYFYSFYKQGLQEDFLAIIYYYTTGVYVFSTLINGTFMRSILDFMKLREISFAKNSNMNTCMKYILARQKRCVTTFKLNRFFNDVNWPYVIKVTTMKHPYKITMEAEGENYLPSYHVTWCDDCKKDVEQELTAQQLTEMKRESQRRALKTKKMSYSRQYENGTMSKQVAQILNEAVDYAMDSDTPVIKIEDMCKKLYEENTFKRFMRKRGEMIAKKREQKIHKKPRTYWRRVCYNIVLKCPTFEKVMLVVVLIHCILILISTYLHSLHENEEHVMRVDYFIYTAKLLFCVVYVIEFVMKIMAYSWIHIFSHGFRRYFRSFWNVTDFIAMIGSILRTQDDCVALYSGEHLKYQAHNRAFDICGLFRFIRLLRVFDIFYADIITFLNRREDVDMTFTFELVKCYAFGEKDVVLMLPRMIQNEKARKDMKALIENEWEILNNVLRKVQKERPWIAITVKTTQVIRMVLQSMMEAIDQLKLSGWVDTIEYHKLSHSLSALYKQVNSIKRVDPSPPKVIFKEVPWMAENQAVIEYLFDHVAVKTYDDGDVIVEEGAVIEGIYIVVTGLVTLTYKPTPRMITRLKQFGQLPIVDHVSEGQYQESYSEHIISGNCIGELGTLTQRPYNCTITSDGYSQAYFLSTSVLRGAMELVSDVIIGLENKIWKEVSVRIAVHLLLELPDYQTSVDDVKYALERSFVPDIIKFKSFVITNFIEDVVLIEGIVIDFNTRDKYVAPCCIPRTVQKLILPGNSLMNVQTEVPVRLLIIPIRDIDEYDVMILAEETCELIHTKTSECLLHTVRHRMHQRRPTLHKKRRPNRPRPPQVNTGNRQGSFVSLFGDSLSGYSKDESDVVSQKESKNEEDVEQNVDEDIERALSTPHFFIR